MQYQRSFYAPYRSVPTPRSTMAAELDQVVRLTCTDATAGKFNLVGTSYAWLNANTLGMLAAERFAMIGRRCYYRGFRLPSTTPTPAGATSCDTRRPSL